LGGATQVIRIELEFDNLEDAAAAMTAAKEALAPNPYLSDEQVLQLRQMSEQNVTRNYTEPTVLTTQEREDLLVWFASARAATKYVDEYETMRECIDNPGAYVKIDLGDRRGAERFRGAFQQRLSTHPAPGKFGTRIDGRALLVRWFPTRGPIG
jgi:hypothetical protein